MTQTLQQAMALHQQGKLEQADALYRKVLDAEPGNVSALYLSGVLAAQAGRNEQAVQLLQQFLSIQPNHAAAHNNLGNALQGLNRIDDAIAS